MSKGAGPTVSARLAELPWTEIEAALWERGHARTHALLTGEECRYLAGLYPNDALFRSRVDMARHRFGLGEYKYFARPLPPLVRDLRTHAYPHLAAIVNRWMEALGSPARYPPRHTALLRLCAEHGQTRPTPLLLRYEAGGYNCLHQDLYGALLFPLQMTAFLSRPGVDYTGGEFLLVEQRPRAQSVGEALLPGQGELVIFTTSHRPARGARGHHRVNVRHGLSRVHTGRRYALGIIFHDAR
ncbi:MAG TPA: 2OG-Fe(II) oxygenase [Vicinamibacteria bacterium]|nr:2OG-Fe(II) oxygenase [Vicinamibacteria bacterium]